jgi:hypothetical protein
MGIGPQNLGAAGMSSKSKPCGTPFKMMEDSPLAKALVGNQKNLPEQLKQKILDAPEDTKKESPTTKLEDLSGDGKVTQKDVLIGRGVIDKDGSKKS